MKKTKILGLLIILGLFLAAPQVMDAQFPITIVCQPPLTTFSDGSATFDISFPPGGGTTCETLADCPKISLPVGATVFSVKVDMHLSDPNSEIGTPFIWIPATTQKKLIQLRTSDGSLVRVFGQGADNCTASDFIYPSRITLIPGGDVWVGNRSFSNNVTRLGKKIGCVGDDCYECKGHYPTCGVQSKGITFDSEGNIWAGSSSSSCLVRLCGHANCTDVNGGIGYSIGDKMVINSGGNTQIGGASAYGLIGDSYGNVWGVNGSTKRININDSNATLHSTGTGDTYGIGINNTGDIWVGKHDSTDIWKIDGADDGGAGIGFIENQCATTSTNTGLAADRINNVWSTGYTGNRIYVIKDGNCASLFTKTEKADGTVGVCTWNQPHGMAVDFDNHAWLVCDTGEVVKYAFHDDGDAIKIDDGEDDIEELLRINLCALPGVGCGNSSGDTYNYSDMTGLRTTPQNLKIGGSLASTLLSSTGTFEVCTDGTVTCTSGLPCAAVTAVLGGCIPNAAGNCEIPLKIFSITAGDYTLSNLEVIYGKEVPVTIGGLVPCDRNWDDPRTPWNEKAPCNFCFLLMMINNIMNFLLMLAAGIAVLALIITGLLFVTSSGDSERKNQSKTALKYSVWGFIIIFISWIIVDFLLIGWGYLDPLGGEWNIVDCDVSQTFCGDNIRQTPNDYGFHEECDGTDNPCAEACSPACTCVAP